MILIAFETQITFTAKILGIGSEGKALLSDAKRHDCQGKKCALSCAV